MSLVEMFVEEIAGFFRDHESHVNGLDISQLCNRGLRLWVGRWDAQAPPSGNSSA